MLLQETHRGLTYSERNRRHLSVKNVTIFDRYISDTDRNTQIECSTVHCGSKRYLGCSLRIHR